MSLQQLTARDFASVRSPVSVSPSVAKSANKHRDKAFTRNCFVTLHENPRGALVQATNSTPVFSLKSSIQRDRNVHVCALPPSSKGKPSNPVPTLVRPPYEQCKAVADAQSLESVIASSHEASRPQYGSSYALPTPPGRDLSLSHLLLSAEEASSKAQIDNLSAVAAADFLLSPLVPTRAFQDIMSFTSNKQRAGAAHLITGRENLDRSSSKPGSKSELVYNFEAEVSQSITAILNEAGASANAEDGYNAGGLAAGQSQSSDQILSSVAAVQGGKPEPFPSDGALTTAKPTNGQKVRHSPASPKKGNLASKPPVQSKHGISSGKRQFGGSAKPEFIKDAAAASATSPPSSASVSSSRGKTEGLVSPRASAARAPAVARSAGRIWRIFDAAGSTGSRLKLFSKRRNPDTIELSGRGRGFSVPGGVIDVEIGSGDVRFAEKISLTPLPLTSPAGAVSQLLGLAPEFFLFEAARSYRRFPPRSWLDRGRGEKTSPAGTQNVHAHAGSSGALPQAAGWTERTSDGSLLVHRSIPPALNPFKDNRVFKYAGVAQLGLDPSDAAARRSQPARRRSVTGVMAAVGRLMASLRAEKTREPAPGASADVANFSSSLEKRKDFVPGAPSTPAAPTAAASAVTSGGGIWEAVVDYTPVASVALSFACFTGVAVALRTSLPPLLAPTLMAMWALEGDVSWVAATVATVLAANRKLYLVWTWALVRRWLASHPPLRGTALQPVWISPRRLLPGPAEGFQFLQRVAAGALLLRAAQSLVVAPLTHLSLMGKLATLFVVLEFVYRQMVLEEIMRAVVESLQVFKGQSLKERAI